MFDPSYTVIEGQSDSLHVVPLISALKFDKNWTINTSWYH